MKSIYNIFSVKITEFDQGQRDPFGFDKFSEKISSKYLPFSGTVRKPIYFFFIAYINWLWNNGKLNGKKKREIQIRLEKLLVYPWIKNYTKKELIGIIGNSKIKINPFKGDDGNWVSQTCFDIYGASVSRIINDDNFINKYRNENKQEEKILNEFLNKQGILDKRNESFLENLLLKLEKKSMFSVKYKLPEKYKIIFKKYLQNAIRNTNQHYYTDISIFFSPSNNWRERLLKKTIENEKEYPFKSFNKWFSSFIISVDRDINNITSKLYWERADKLYLSIPGNYRIELKPRPNPRCWFERIGNKYVTKNGNEFDENAWNALVRRAEGEYFYDFKHKALISLISEII